MSKINLLNDHLTNMIAAGEVVERPMGIIKELVENSIDAKASKIDVEILNGGITQIRVIDNGCGMEKRDASMAFQRHATSKIKNEKDLWSINTMGFRGEALPSIASVSKIKLLTSDSNDMTKIEMEYGQTKCAQVAMCPQGTDITVTGLFHKTPARLKHLKSEYSETNAIVEIMEKFALSYPEIAFSLTCDNNTKIETTGSNQLVEVVYKIYGKEVSDNAVEYETANFDFKVKGLLILPHITRASKKNMVVFVNHRIVRNYGIQKAIMDGYHKFIQPDRYPLCFIDIEMDPQLVDVNIHPSKWEIKISKEKQMLELITSSIEETLQNKMTVKPTVITPNNENIEPKVQETLSFNYPDFKVNEIQQVVDNQTNYQIIEENQKEVVEKKVFVEEKPATVINNLPHMEVIGQWKNCYIIAQGEAGLYIIDQHAAQEKFNFERFSKYVKNYDIKKQQLLIPLMLDITPTQKQRINEINENLGVIGINFELFGNNSIVCRELPTWMQGVEYKEFLQDMIELFDGSKQYSVEVIQEKAIASLACHFSIKFNKYLTKQEMEQVIVDLGRCEKPYTCPHGRPTIICLSEKEMLKEFKRV